MKINEYKNKGFTNYFERVLLWLSNIYDSIENDHNQTKLDLKKTKLDPITVKP